MHRMMIRRRSGPGAATLSLLCASHPTFLFLARAPDQSAVAESRSGIADVLQHTRLDGHPEHEAGAIEHDRRAALAVLAEVLARPRLEKHVEGDVLRGGSESAYVDWEKFAAIHVGDAPCS